MLKKLIIGLVFPGSLLLLSAQTFTANCSGGICTIPVTPAENQIKPQAVPTSPTTIVSGDVYLKTVVVTNTTAGAITFTLADKQVSPVSVLSAVSIAANTTYVIVFPARYWCPGGFTVTSGGAGLNFYAEWNQ